MTVTTVQVRQKGIITLPVELRRRYGLSEGDVYSLLDMGNGSFLLTPRVSRVAQLGDEVGRLMAEEGVNVEEMLEALDEERETYYREHYARS